MRLLFAGLLLSLVMGSASASHTRRAKEISVKIHSTVATAGKMKIGFLELVEDSRCPVDTNCIWAGNAKIKVRVTKGHRSKVIELNTLETGKVPSFAGYQFKLTGLSPEPRSNIRIDRNGYVATIAIIRVR